jgi:hypothetical protein
MCPRIAYKIRLIRISKGLNQVVNTLVVEGFAREFDAVIVLTNQRESRMIASPKTKYFYSATSPSGKARVCKTLTMGSIPIVASLKHKRSALFSGQIVCV